MATFYTDPSIALRGMREPESISDLLLRFAQLKRIAQEGRYSDLRTREAQLSLQELERQLKEQGVVRGAMAAGVGPIRPEPASQNFEGLRNMFGPELPQPEAPAGAALGFDRQRALTALSGGGAAYRVPEIQQQFAAQDIAQQKGQIDLAEQLTKLNTAQLANASKRVDIMGSLAQSVLVNPGSYPQAKGTAESLGLIPPNTFPEQYTPDLEPQLRSLVAQSLSVKDMITTEETKRHNRAQEQRKPVPGVDLPLPADVEAQRKRIAAAGATARDRAREPEIEAAAQALIDPRSLTALRDVVSMRGDQRLRVYVRAKELDPKFDPGLVNQRIRFLQSYEDPKGRAAINRQAINNILQHAGDLSELNKQYGRTNVRFLNSPINTLSRQFGSEAYVNYATTLGVLKDELSLYFAGGYAPVEKQHEMWLKILNEDATPGQVEAFTKEVVHLGLRRATTFNSQFKKNMGYDDPNMIVPEAAEAGTKLGLGAELKKFGSGGKLGERPKAGPEVGAVEGGYKFKGGDPANPANWEKVP